jgi:ParB/RepB/Spo0J family partition protein
LGKFKGGFMAAEVKRIEDFEGGDGTKVVRKNMFFVPPDLLQVEPGHNGRKVFSGIEELADSIAAHGIEQPLKIRREKDAFFIVDGERRFRAVQLAQKRGVEIAAVPCVLLEKHQGGEAERTMSMFVANRHRQDFTALEEAEVFDRLLRWGWTEERIAKESACTTTNVKNRLLLMTAGQKAQKALQENKVSATAVLELLRRFPDDRGSQDEALAEVMTASSTNGAGVSTKQVREIAAKNGHTAAPRKRTLPWKDLDKLSRRISVKLRGDDLKAAERNELEGMKRGIRVAMNLEALPSSLEE